MKCATSSFALTVLVASITAAAGAEVPAQYRGLWCNDSKGYYRCRKATSEAYLHIRRDRINLSEEGDCRITAVTTSAKGHRLRVYCPPDVLSDPPEHVNLQLDARGRLHFDSTEAEATGWEYDWRRCIVSRNVGNFGFRFWVDYLPPYVIDFAISDLRDPDFKVGSVWLGSASWVLDDGKLGSRAEVLPHLRQGNTLVAYSTDGNSVFRWQIEGGDKVVKFLNDCPRYWESGAWERRHRKRR